VRRSAAAFGACGAFTYQAAHFYEVVRFGIHCAFCLAFFAIRAGGEMK